ncbi:MAG: cobalt/nickel transport system permease protein [Clostridiales bacterium]|nr:cobalt/nickel transport system permease protein [Clostridiales bacterium]
MIFKSIFNRFRRVHPGIRLVLMVIWLIAVVQTKPEHLHYLIFWMLLQLPHMSVEPKKWGRQMLMAEPFLLFVGLSYLFVYRAPATYYHLTLTEGIWAFIALLLRGNLAVMGITAFVNAISMEGLADGMRWLKVPETFVLIMMQTYRYIGLMVQKVHQMTTAYCLRSGGKTGVHLDAWGSFPGQLLLLSLKQAEATHEAMMLRGYNPAASYIGISKIQISDLTDAIIWLLLFAAVPFVL